MVKTKNVKNEKKSSGMKVAIKPIKSTEKSVKKKSKQKPAPKPRSDVTIQFDSPKSRSVVKRGTKHIYASYVSEAGTSQQGLMSPSIKKPAQRKATAPQNSPHATEVLVSLKSPPLTSQRLSRRNTSTPSNSKATQSKLKSRKEKVAETPHRNRIAEPLGRKRKHTDLETSSLIEDEIGDTSGTSASNVLAPIEQFNEIEFGHPYPFVIKRPVTGTNRNKMQRWREKNLDVSGEKRARALEKQKSRDMKPHRIIGRRLGAYNKWAHLGLPSKFKTPAKRFNRNNAKVGMRRMRADAIQRGDIEQLNAATYDFSTLQYGSNPINPEQLETTQARDGRTEGLLFIEGPHLTVRDFTCLLFCWLYCCS